MHSYISLGLFFYFKKIEVNKEVNIPKHTPLLFVPNHQNALLDPLIIAVTSGISSYFLTRAQVFKKPLVSKILKSLKLIPVFRVRDGWKTITQNNTVFSYCVSLLNANEAVTIFPEGNHNLKRTVRPLSKGFTRIVFEVLDKNPQSKLKLIPIGLNYENMLACPDAVVVNYGKPIAADHYNLGDRNVATKMLKETVHKALTKLTTHIESNNYEVNLALLNSKNADFLNPNAVNRCINSSFKDCDFNPKAKQNIYKPFFKTLLIIVCFVPYLIWKKMVQPKIKELEFTATFRFAIAVTLVPLWVLFVTIGIGFVFSSLIAILFLISTIIAALLAVKL